MDRRLFAKLLKRIDRENINVLDVGGGNGGLLDIIKSIHPRVVKSQVVDIDRGARDIAEMNGHDFFLGRIEDFSSMDRFDLILVLNLIEHVSSPVNVMARLASLLNDKGIILIKTPNIKSLDAELFRGSYWGGLHCPRHWVLFSERSFRKVISESGLRVDEIDYTQGAPFWALSVIVWLQKYGLVKTDPNGSIMKHTLYPFLSVLFALFDMVRGSLFKTSQMFIVLSNNKDR